MVSNKTLRYPALVDGREGAYGVVFPDLPGCVAMGYTVEDALINAEDALRDYTLDADQDGEILPEPSPFQSMDVPKGSQLVGPSVFPQRSPTPQNDPHRLYYLDGPTHRTDGRLTFSAPYPPLAPAPPRC